MIIACTIDERYIIQCATMLRSLRLADPGATCAVRLLHDGVSREAIDPLIQYLRGLYDDVAGIALDTRLLRGFPVNGHVSVATYFRLLLPSALPANIERVLFLDCDVIIADSLSPLWQTDLRGAPLGAVESPNPDANICRLRFSADEKYFNAGVLLADLAAWRRRSLLEESRAFAASHPERIQWWDQDVLNQLFRGRWQRLHPRWNALPQLWSPDDSFRGRIPRCPDSLADSGGPAIVHFAGGGACKPWNYYCRHPYAEDYRRLAAQTPWGCGPLEGAPTLARRVKDVIKPVLAPFRKILP